MQATLPNASSAQSDLVATLMDIAPKASGWLIWVMNWGAWSDGYREFWQRIRRNWGETRSLLDAPIVAFGADEQRLARGMARLVLLFGWDAHLVCLPASLVVYISHDEYMELYTPNIRALRTVETRLARLGIEKWT